MRSAAALLLAALAVPASAAGPAGPTVWRLGPGEVEPAAGSRERHPVGSLQKPWVVRAWAEAHPDPSAPPPAATCRAGGGCWLRDGHGEIGLLLATALSCNAYFLTMARDLPEGLLERTLRDAGFAVREPLDPWEGAGLGSRGRGVTISPAALLRAYRELVSRPWPARDELRRELLDGMRLSAREGTGSPLGDAALLVKTGTVDALDGAPAATSGWALAADPAGTRLALALLPRGTGSEAAASLGGLLARTPPTVPGAAPRTPRAPGAAGAARREAPDSVRVRLLASLRPDGIEAVNAGSEPVRLRDGDAGRWVGAGAAVALRAGVRLEPGLWELRVSPYRLVRVVRGAVDAGALARGGLTLTLTAQLRDYVEGVLEGELRHARGERAEALAAAVLRFLSRGRRHGAEDVCDLVHCARFAGLGPAVAWTTPERAVLSEPRPHLRSGVLDDEAWQRVLDGARSAGPSLWSGDCGGAPLSERAVWGSGPREAFPCPRHPVPLARSAWSRTVTDAALTRSFGAPVVELAAFERDGVRLTRVVAGGRSVELLYDELHRRLSSAAGWDALPSPPDSFERVAGGYVVRGRGRGHRVGICLAD